MDKITKWLSETPNHNVFSYCSFKRTLRLDNREFTGVLHQQPKTLYRWSKDKQEETL